MNMNNLAINILQEVSDYYMLTEAKKTVTLDSVINHFRNNGYPNLDAAGMLNILKSADPTYKPARDVEGANGVRHIPEIPGNFRYWLGYRYLDGSVNQENAEGIKQMLAAYGKAVKSENYPEQCKIATGTADCGVSVEDIQNGIQAVEEANRQLEGGDEPEEEGFPGGSTGDPWVDYALGIGAEYESVHGDTPRQIGVEDQGELPVYEDSNYIIICPTNIQASRRLGGSAFTATPDSLRNSAYKYCITRNEDGDEMITNYPFGWSRIMGYTDEHNHAIPLQRTNGQHTSQSIQTRGCGWCTQDPNTDGYYNDYLRRGVQNELNRYYIIFAKHPQLEFNDGEPKNNINMWQLHTESNQFLGPGDKPINFERIQAKHGSVAGVVRFLKSINRNIDRWTNNINLAPFEEMLPNLLDPNQPLEQNAEFVDVIEGTGLTLVKYGGHATFLTDDRQVVINPWVFDINRYMGDYFLLVTDNTNRAKKNLYNAREHRLIYGTLADRGNWFNDIRQSAYGVCVVDMNLAVRDDNGHAIEQNGMPVIMDKKNVLNLETGQLLINNGNRYGWLDGVDNNINGYSRVKFNMPNGKTVYNYIKQGGTLLVTKQYSEWFDFATDFTNQGYSLVGMSDNYGLLNSEGQLLGNSWFYEIGGQPNQNGQVTSIPRFQGQNRIISVVKEVGGAGYANVMRSDGSYVWNHNIDDWFNDVVGCFDDYSIVLMDDGYNVLLMNGELMFDHGVESINPGTGCVMVTDNGRTGRVPINQTQQEPQERQQELAQGEQGQQAEDMNERYIRNKKKSIDANIAESIRRQLMKL